MSSCPWANRSILGFVISLLLAAATPATHAGGLRVSYRGGNWAASVRFGSSWSFRCAPGLINRPCGYYPGAYYGYGYGYYYPSHGYDYGYTGYIGEYYGVRYLSSSAPAPAPAPVGVQEKEKPALSATDPDSELKQVLAEIAAERHRKPAAEAEMDPRIVVPEALANMAGLPEIQPMAFKKVR